MERKYKYTVATRCMTFNHAPYIKDALLGFAMQETSFPVVFMIVDDASTDGEQDILKKWAEENLKYESLKTLWCDKSYGKLAVGSFKKKPLSTFVILLLSENHNQFGKKRMKFEYISEWNDNAKYNALCEGDDYWISPQKLSLQVDWLDNHKDYGMCFTNFNIENRKSGRYLQDVFTTYPNRFKSEYTIESWILLRGFTCPPSWLCRHDLYKRTMPPVLETKDTTFVRFAQFLYESKVHCLKDYTTVTYRALPESSSRSKDYNKIKSRWKSVLDTQLKLIQIYKLDEGLLNKCTRQAYSSFLVQMILHNDILGIKEAKFVLKNNLSVKEGILIQMSKFSFFRIVVKALHRLKHKHEIA